MTYQKIDTRSLRQKILSAIEGHDIDEVLRVMDKIALPLRRNNSAIKSFEVSKYKPKTIVPAK